MNVNIIYIIIVVVMFIGLILISMIESESKVSLLLAKAIWVIICVVILYWTYYNSKIFSADEGLEVEQSVAPTRGDKKSDKSTPLVSYVNDNLIIENGSRKLIFKAPHPIYCDDGIIVFHTGCSMINGDRVDELKRVIKKFKLKVNNYQDYSSPTLRVFPLLTDEDTIIDEAKSDESVQQIENPQSEL
jgi:hypothetical protein